MRIEIEGPKETSLTTVGTGPLKSGGKLEPISVGQLVRRLSSMFPPDDAEAWDRTGLLVGDPTWQVEGVVCALDPTVSAVRFTRDSGANVLLTHHPAFREGPEQFVPGGSDFSGALVFEAASNGVCLVNYHTALDVSPAARTMLPGMLGLTCSRLLEPLPGDPDKGYGHVCYLQPDERLTLDLLARRCLSVFGRMPRVWGRADKKLKSVVTWTGSAGDALERCLAQGVDAIVCGEVKYHPALQASEMGLGIIELGHDVSELPFAGVLAEACVAAGVESSLVKVMKQDSNWSYPESRRA